MKEAFDKMLGGESEAPPAGGDVDLSDFEDSPEEPDEDTKLNEALSSIGYTVDPDKLMQIKDILKAEPPMEGGEPGAAPAPAKPKSQLESMFGGAKA